MRAVSLKILLVTGARGDKLFGLRVVTSHVSQGLPRCTWTYPESSLATSCVSSQPKEVVILSYDYSGKLRLEENTSGSSVSPFR
ncbi:hypothetical protein F5Y17DRAFT_420185 [Xylariaceae sp. FL0594]|nr:hypothetical protein F5Y17DRAFT_420185 [Xylariaceae sp. FL0594]